MEQDSCLCLAISPNHLLTAVANPASFTVLHVTFGPTTDASPSLGAGPKIGITEIVFFYLPGTQTSAQKDAVAAGGGPVRGAVVLRRMGA